MFVNPSGFVSQIKGRGQHPLQHKLIGNPVFLVKNLQKGIGLEIGNIHFPKEYYGKHIRLKVEVMEGDNMGISVIGDAKPKDSIDKYNEEVEQYNKKWDEIADLFVEIGQKIKAINDSAHDEMCEGGTMCFCKERKRKRLRQDSNRH